MAPTLPKLEPKTDLFSCQLRLSDPRLIEKGSPALRFGLDMLDKDGSVFLSIPGFRVIRGKIKPPSRLQGRGYVDTLELSLKFGGLLESMVQVWRDEFETVEFPASRERE